MNGFLLDTDVISELIKSEPNGNVLRWIDDIDETILFLSVLTLGEIRNGIERLNPGRRRGRLESWLTVDLRVRFRDRILTLNEPIAERWGALSAIAAKKGRPVPVIDGLLAATALHHDLMLVTRDDTDVSGTGVPIFDPWQ
jgi:predicted nucleic acid-binding protein